MVQEPISRIDVQSGTLYFRGHSAVELATDRKFEDVLYLLVHGVLPEPGERDALSLSLVSKREASLVPPSGSSLVSLAEGMEGVEKEPYEKLLGLVAAIPIAVASAYRASNGREAVPQNASLNHAANLLWMLTGIEQAERNIRDFETCLILHMDDPENPSLSRLLQALNEGGSIAVAVGTALRAHGDPLHHGAGSLAANMVLSLAQEDDLHEAMAEKLDRGERLYGLGHRIYRTMDPRAKELRRILVSRTKGTDMSWLPNHVEDVAKAGADVLLERKGLVVHPNVDLYNALVYSTFGLATDVNTQLFAVSRAAGWTAHTVEFLGI